MGAHYDDLRDKHVLITGGAAGIGAALTDAFADQASRVTILDKDGEAGAAMRDKHAAQDIQILFESLDLTDEPALIDALARAQQQHGPVDVLINNAGWDPRYDFLDMSTEQWEQLFRINIGHYYVTCRELLPAMIERKSGSIIMTTSVEFYLAHARLVCYTATKAAIIGMVKSLATEVGRHNIRVNAVAPGWVMTERQLRDMITPEIRKKLLEEWQVLPYTLTPEMLAPPFLFLASDASVAITRQTLIADAGLAQA